MIQWHYAAVASLHEQATEIQNALADWKSFYLFFSQLDKHSSYVKLGNRKLYLWVVAASADESMICL